MIQNDLVDSFEMLMEIMRYIKFWIVNVTNNLLCYIYFHIELTKKNWMWNDKTLFPIINYSIRLIIYLFSYFNDINPYQNIHTVIFVEQYFLKKSRNSLGLVDYNININVCHGFIRVKIKL